LLKLLLYLAEGVFDGSLGLFEGWKRGKVEVELEIGFNVIIK
jgi:hypothetical protein